MENPEIDLLGSCREMRIADIDGDGIEDILVSGSIGIQKCAGNNTLNFGPSDTLINTDDSHSFGTGDIDLDGDIDIVLGTQDSIITYLQGPLNTYTRLSAFAVVVGEIPTCIILIDVSGDGLCEMMWSSRYVGNFHVRKNLGSGVWASIATYPCLGVGCQEFVAVDLNNDNYPDVAAASTGISVFRNYGNGTFQSAISVWNSGGFTSCITARDLDGNGYRDLIVGSDNGSNLSLQTVSFFKNNGSLQFQNMSYYDAGGQTNALTTTDMNGDGIWDVVTADHYSNSISVLIGTGNFVFNKLIQYTADADVDIESDDYDNDGDYDILGLAGGSVCVFANDSSNRIISQTRFPGYHVANWEPSMFEIEVKDVDGDTRPELITGGNMILLMKDTGYKNFAPWTYYFTSYTIDCLKAEDMNGDGYPDIIYSSFFEDSVYVMLNNGNGIYNPPLSFYVGTYVGFFRIDDIDNDSDLDILLPRHLLNKISIMYNDGSGNFPTIQDIASTNNPNCLAIGDFNGDSLPEIVVGHNTTTNVDVFTNLGSGNFSTQTYTGLGTSQVIQVADTDHDGDNDFAVYGVNSNIRIFKNNGGVFTFFGTSLGGGNFEQFQFGDLTGDTLPDLVGVFFSGLVEVHINFGNDSFAFCKWTGPAGCTSTDIAIADFDNDFDNDILTPTISFGSINVNENCDTTLYSPPSPPAGISHHEYIFGDISIQPNPFSNETVVLVNHFGHPDQIKLFDIAGKEVTSLFKINLTEDSDNSFKVHLITISAKPGTYFLQLSNAEGSSSIGKLMIVK